MKKLLLFLALIVAFTANSQTKKAPVKKPLTQEQKAVAEAKKYFELYVHTSFKDPYSYKLQKIWAAPNTMLTMTESLIRDYDFDIKYTDTTTSFRKAEKVAKIKEAIQKKKEVEDGLKQFSEKQINEVVDYTIYIDAYGNNSFGNKVLGRYVMKVGKNGEFLELPRKIED